MNETTWCFARDYIEDMVFSAKYYIILTVLIILVVISSFAVVYTKDLYRRSFVEYQTLLKNQDQAMIMRSKLLLQQGSLSSSQRIQSIASKRLGMKLLTPQDIVMIDVSSK